MSMSNGLRAVARSPSLHSKAVTVDTLVAAGYPVAGTETGESFARKLSAVDRCIEILSDSIGKLPNYLFDSKTRRRIPDDPVLQLLNIRPNEAMTPTIRKKVLETSRLVDGNGYDWILRDERTGRIQELIPVPGHLVEPWQDLSGRVWYTVMHPWTGEPMVLPNEDICHYKGATRDGLKGVAVLPPVKNNPGQIWRGAPKLGQDNEDILEELGYSNEEIEAMYAEGKIGKAE